MQRPAIDGLELVSVRGRGSESHDLLVVDLAGPENWPTLLERVEPTVVVNCAAIADVELASRNVDLANRINVELPRFLARESATCGFHFIHLSSNAVYDGDAAPYDERAAHRPLHEYGTMKSAADVAIRESRGRATIVRPTVGYGWNEDDGRLNPLTAALRALGRGERIRQVTDQFENPVYAGDVADVLWAVVTQGFAGELNVGGADRHLSRFDWMKQVLPTFGFEVDRLDAAKVADFKSTVRRPRDTTFDCTRLQEVLGCSTKNVVLGATAMMADATATMTLQST